MNKANKAIKGSFLSPSFQHLLREYCSLHLCDFYYLFYRGVFQPPAYCDCVRIRHDIWFMLAPQATG